jgi:hypothetical protein
VPEVLQEAAWRDVIRKKEVRQPVPVHVGRDASGGLHLRQEIEPGAGRGVTKTAGPVVQEKPRAAIRDDDVHGAVPVDIHEQNSRMVVRRGEAEIRRFHGIEGLVRGDETARGGFVEKMRRAAPDRRAPADGGSGTQLPTDLRRRIIGFAPKKREIVEG